MEIKQLETRNEWNRAFPLLQQLRTHLDRPTYLNYLAEMTEDGYRLFGNFNGEELVALAGVGIEFNLYYGRHLWVYELVTDKQHRSEGYGEELMNFLERWAVERDCENIALSSGVQREAAHRFYKERADMEPVSYVFKKTLS